MSHHANIHSQLGIEEVEISKDKVVLKMPVDYRTIQPFGILHGGATLVMAESAASIGSLLQLNPESAYPVGLEINANHLRSVRTGFVYATAVPIHIGKKTMVWDIRITDEQHHLVCVSRCTVAILEKRKAEHSS